MSGRGFGSVKCGFVAVTDCTDTSSANERAPSCGHCVLCCGRVSQQHRGPRSVAEMDVSSSSLRCVCWSPLAAEQSCPKLSKPKGKLC